MEAVVSIRQLSVVLGGQHKALSNIDVEFLPGKITGVIGPSGAGKTTLIRSIVGSLCVSPNQVKIFGESAGSASLRKRLNYMTQELSIYPDLTVTENLQYFATMYLKSRKQVKEAIKAALQSVDLTSKAGNVASSLSGGEKQRVSLAIALIGSPELLVLDEPTVGLDPVLREKLWCLFSKLTSQGATIIVSSHSMDEAERCDDLVLIRDGKLIAHSSPEALRQRTGTKTIEESFLKLVKGAPDA